MLWRGGESASEGKEWLINFDESLEAGLREVMIAGEGFPNASMLHDTTTAPSVV